MSNSSQLALSEQSKNNYLRGLAIVAVITIHLLASFDNIYRLTNHNWYIFTVIDQLSRFSVPLFVTLSGYGFWEKYLHTNLRVWNFIYRQASKLLPLYLLASLVSYIVFLIIPTWRVASTPSSFLVQIMTGRADYQLYFVPMIFQLYLLFPLLRKLVQKYPWSSLISAGVFELSLYYIFTMQDLPQQLSKYLASDQQQYVWFFTWIFYFILGMHLARIVAWIRYSAIRVFALFVTTTLSLILVSSNAISNLSSGLDPIIALRFTRIDILIYATFTIMSLFVLSSLIQNRAKSVTHKFIKIGTVSYPIYLFHTLVLRLIFAFA